MSSLNFIELAIQLIALDFDFNGLCDGVRLQDKAGHSRIRDPIWVCEAHPICTKGIISVRSLVLSISLSLDLFLLVTGL